MKHIIISGAGEVGRYSAEVLQSRGHSITVIDTNLAALERLEHEIEARLIHGSSCSAEILEEAQISKADVLIAATSLDEINFLTAAIGKKMGVGHVIARIHQRSFVQSRNVDYADVFNIDSLICPEELTSEAICAQLADPGVAAVQRFAGDEMEMHQVELTDGCIACSKPLKDLVLPAGVRIVTLKRDAKTLIPDGESHLRPGDLARIIVPVKVLAEVKKLFNNRGRHNQDIVIAGASDVSEWLLNHININRHSVRLFESDLEQAERIANLYRKVTVLNADPVDGHVFQSEHLENIDSFVAAGKNEEHNILAAIQAKNKGVKSTFAIIHNSAYLSSLRGIGIDFLFSPRFEAAKEVLRLVDDDPIKILSQLDDGLNVYELSVASQAKGAGLTLKEINFPRATIIAAIQRGGRVIAPTPNDQIKGGDTLVVVGPTGTEETLKNLFI